MARKAAIVDEPVEASLLQLLEDGYGIMQWARPSDGRWYLASVQADLFGTRILELRWGGPVRRKGSTQTHRLNELSAVALRRLAKRVAGRRRVHGYRYTERGDRDADS